MHAPNARPNDARPNDAPRPGAPAQTPAELLDDVRLHFAFAAEDAKRYAAGRDALQRLARAQGADALVQTYQAAFLAIEANYKTWPLEKFKLVTEALRRVDALVARNPAHLEIRFVRAAICANLPAVFGRRAQATADFRAILDLAPQQREQYPDAVLAFVLDFMLQSRLLPSADRRRAETLLAQLETQAKAS